MKRLYIIAVLFILTASYASAQVVTERCWHLDKIQFLDQKQDFWRSHKLYSTTAKPLDMITGGYYNLTEGHYGFGLYDRSVSFSDHYIGITTVNGWRFGNGVALGVGVGYFNYNDGYAVPLFGDARYFIGKQKNKFFFMGSGGFLLNFKDSKEYSRFFGNPGAGIAIPLARSTQLSFSVGLMSQWVISKFTQEYSRRDSFINMKLGLIFGK
jgi:hypothetical protein